jgi:hypothetical protein
MISPDYMPCLGRKVTLACMSEMFLDLVISPANIVEIPSGGTSDVAQKGSRNKVACIHGVENQVEGQSHLESLAGARLQVDIGWRVQAAYCHAFGWRVRIHS